MKKLKKGIIIITSVIGITFVLCILQYAIHYYNNPVEKEINFTAAGYIIFNPDGREWEKVDVEVNGKSLHYIYKNRLDAAQGDIFVNGYSIFGNIEKSNEYIGFYTEFHNPEFACVSQAGSSTLCKIVSLSKDFQSIVCGINLSPNILDSEKTGWNGQAILVIPSNSVESAKEIIKNASLNSQQMKNWLTENGWNKIMEAGKE